MVGRRVPCFVLISRDAPTIEGCHACHLDRRERSHGRAEGMNIKVMQEISRCAGNDNIGGLRCVVVMAGLEGDSRVSGR